MLNISFGFFFYDLSFLILLQNSYNDPVSPHIAYNLFEIIQQFTKGSCEG